MDGCMYREEVGDEVMRRMCFDGAGHVCLCEIFRPRPTWLVQKSCNAIYECPCDPLTHQPHTMSKSACIAVHPPMTPMQQRWTEATTKTQKMVWN